MKIFVKQSFSTPQAYMYVYVSEKVLRENDLSRIQVNILSLNIFLINIKKSQEVSEKKTLLDTK